MGTGQGVLEWMDTDRKGCPCSTEGCLGDACLQALPCFSQVSPYPLPSPVTSCLPSALMRHQSSLRPVLSLFLSHLT